MDRDFEITQRSELVVLLLGTNIGDKAGNLRQALTSLKEVMGEPIEISSVYETEPWGNVNQSSFLNLAVVYNSNLKPLVLLETILNIEQDLGRVRKEKWGPRIIDIDIIFYGNLVYQSDILEIPHPYLQERLFVLDPLMEIMPDFEHPLLEKSIRTLRTELLEKEESSE